MGKKILPMVLVVVSMSGSCELRTAKPIVNGLAVHRTRDVPADASAAWVIAIIAGKELSYFTSLGFGRAIVSYLAHWFWEYY